MTRSDLINGLQTLWIWATFETIDKKDCKKIADLCDAALAILKDPPQLTRLVTYDDFHSGREDSGGAIPCWKESKSPTRRSGWAVIVYGKMLADTETGVARYWNNRPTEEQRKEMAWPEV